MLKKIKDIKIFSFGFLKKRFVLHFLFWIFFTLFYSFVYGPTYESFTLKLYHTLFLLPVAIIASYFTMMVLIDKLLLENKYIVFSLAFVLSALFFTFLQVCVYYYFIFPKLYPLANLNQLIHIDRFLIELLRLYAIVTLTTALKLLRHWNRIRSVNLQLSEKNLMAELKIKEIEKQKIEAELNTLKSQLNPHFLFNVLNSIYSHSLLKSDIAPSIVLKLSDLMSYILYDCKAKLVSLQKEVEFIKNYIELEKIRLEEDIEVKFNIKNIDGVSIPPLLFVPLIENAFKHGIGTNPKNKCISLSISIINRNFYFNLKNSKGAIENSMKKNSKGGIGIHNVKKRLSLLYPDKHSINILNYENSYSVKIIIYEFTQKRN
ncbi:MAG: hypothetical protein GXO79_15845 [Chlorobi bacterium]|nr:hypothetical protein [Chlorobiota bacterium]